MKDTVRFGDFVEVNPRIRLEKGKEYPYVEMAAVTPGNGFVSPQAKRVYKGAGSRFQSGDTLFARITPCLENGKIVQFRHSADGPCFGSTEFFVFRGKPNVSDSTYIFYLALSRIIRDTAEKSMTGASGRQRAMLSVVEDIRVPAIPLPIQRRIVAILSPYDELIRNNTRRIEILEEMARIIYRQWFVEFQFPEHENVPMVESELGMIPQGWEVKELGEVVSEIIDYRGKTPKKLGGDWSESGIMALSAMNVKQGRLVNLEKAKFVSEELYKKWMKSEVEKNDILMTSEAPLGEVYCLAEKKKICLSQRLFCIRANPNIIKPSVLFYAIRSPAIQNQLHARATGTTVAGIRQSALRKISVIIPPLQLQSRTESVLGTLISTRETLDKKNINLRKTRDLLLPQLISSELDVSKLDVGKQLANRSAGEASSPNQF